MTLQVTEVFLNIRIGHLGIFFLHKKSLISVVMEHNVFPNRQFINLGILFWRGNSFNESIMDSHL